MEKIIKEIKEAKQELSDTQQALLDLTTVKKVVKENKRTDYRIDNLTSSGVNYFKSLMGVEILDSTSFKKSAKRAFEKKMVELKTNSISSEVFKERYLNNIFKNGSKVLNDYNNILIV